MSTLARILVTTAGRPPRNAGGIEPSGLACALQSARTLSFQEGRRENRTHRAERTIEGARAGAREQAGATRPADARRRMAPLRGTAAGGKAARRGHVVRRDG